VSATLKNRSFNVRVSFDEAGEAVIGFVQGFYKATENCIDIKAVPDSTVLAIAKKLSITRSSRLLSVNRRGRASSATPQQGNMEFVSL